MRLSILLAISLLPFDTQEKFRIAHEHPSLSTVLRYGVSKKKVTRMLKFLTDSKTQVCFYGMDTYPRMFFALDNPPFRLMYTKTLPSEDQKLLTLCGTRNPDPRSRESAYGFALESAANNVVLVTSNSRGIDRSALWAYHDYGCEAFVLCDCGLGTNRIKSNALLSSMSLISPYQPYDEALSVHCLSRNVLSAALSETTLVMQAPGKSGALHVAGSALDQGKDVFVHASALADGPRYQGSCSLVEMGAGVVEDFAELAALAGFSATYKVQRGSSSSSLYRFGSSCYSIFYG